MLVLTRRTGQSIQIGEDIEITVAQVRGEGNQAQVRLAVRAPREVAVDRKEIADRKASDRQALALASSLSRTNTI